jgi:hypothetical protein
MKNSVRQLRQIQRKVIRSCRQEASASVATSLPERPALLEICLSEPKRMRCMLLPKLMKAQAYH